MSPALVCQSFLFIGAVISVQRVLVTHMLPAVNITGCSCPVPQKWNSHITEEYRFGFICNVKMTKKRKN